ncbi:uncharacterized protein LOC123537540 [Mercenaria mercenaria]|uniref:uncharacterized protein LOC123537540 n=1 Tax=Mercenaria mercenaria TaxID=6596 RepID=UPI00234E38A1|nr:uncharacterized protein LOC123537540 [Mercenaria mercenaria]
MGQHFTKTENKFLVECQSQLSQLDGMLLGIASSVDSMHITFTQLLRQLEELNPDKTDGFKQNHFDNIELTKKLLSSVENGLSHQKTTLLQEISQFARMIKRGSDPRKSISNSIPALDDLKIDHYLSTGKVPEVSDKIKKVEHVERHEQPPKDIERNIASLKEQNRLCLTKMKTLEEKSQQLMKENDELKTKITKLENEGIQLVPVQLYCQKRSDQMGLALQEIMTQLSGKEIFGNTKVAFIVCEQSTDIQPNLPLLALCFNASRIGTDATNAIQGIKKSENTALLILHHKDEHALPNQSSERVLADPEFKSLGGIFDIAFLAGKGIYLCERNTLAIVGITTFLTKVLAETPLKIKTI